MKAFTLTQPWASLVTTGEKKYETRSWQTKYRGPLVIHSAKTFPKPAREICFANPVFRLTLERLGFQLKNLQVDMLFGFILGMVDLVEVSEIDDTFKFNSNSLTSKEMEFGDYTNGRYAWKFENPRTILPIKAKGALSLWKVPGPIEATIKKELGL